MIQTGEEIEFKEIDKINYDPYDQHNKDMTFWMAFGKESKEFMGFRIKIQYGPEHRIKEIWMHDIKQIRRILDRMS